MSIEELAETFIEINTMTPEQAHACRKLAWWLANTTSRQLITLAEAQAMVAADQWQPIETAPKDEMIDIWLADGKRWCDCYYDMICDEWRTSRPSGRLLSIKARFVTHWMPTPRSPLTEGTPT